MDDVKGFCKPGGAWIGFNAKGSIFRIGRFPRAQAKEISTSENFIQGFREFC